MGFPASEGSNLEIKKKRIIAEDENGNLLMILIEKHDILFIRFI
jgi:hypothetical protein